MEPEHSLTFGPFRLDLTHRRLWRGEQVIGLRPRTLAVLCYLVEHPGRLVTKAELRQHVWAGAHVTDSVLRVSVREIRAALGDLAAMPRYLETVGSQGYRFLVGGDQDVPPPPAPGPVVGRQCEVEALEQWYQRAADGWRQMVFVSGEAGIGKTTVIDLWLARLAAGNRVRIARGQCIEHYAEGKPYLPLLEALGQFSRQSGGSEVFAVLRRYAPMWLAQLPGSVSETELERLRHQVQGATSARMLRALAEALDVLAAETPLVLVLEDLHWSDSSTVECLGYMAQRRAPVRLLLLGTYRPVETGLLGHPLRSLVQELCGRGQGIELRLEVLPAESAAVYLAGRLGGPVAAPLVAFVHEPHRWQCAIHGEHCGASGAAGVNSAASGGMDIAGGGRGQADEPAAGGTAAHFGRGEGSGGGDRSMRSARTVSRAAQWWVRCRRGGAGCSRGGGTRSAPLPRGHRGYRRWVTPRRLPRSAKPPLQPESRRTPDAGSPHRRPTR
jgi:DNA-binding winged helix-turn-helix (wHTH) protein